METAATLRQRGAGVWEILVSVDPDPVTGFAVQHPVTVRGGLARAERRRQLLAGLVTALRERRQRPLRSVGSLLVWLAGEHDWEPSTWRRHRLGGAAWRRRGWRDGSRRVSPHPSSGRRRTDRPRPAPSGIALNVRMLRAAFGWEFEERLIVGPLQGVRGPAQPEPRYDVPREVVRDLLQAPRTT